MKKILFIVLVLLLVFALLLAMTGCTFYNTRDDAKDTEAIYEASDTEKVSFQDDRVWTIKIDGLGDINNDGMSQGVYPSSAFPKWEFSWDERHTVVEKIKNNELPKEFLYSFVSIYKTDTITIPNLDMVFQFPYVDENPFMSAKLSHRQIELRYSLEDQPFSSTTRDCFYYYVMTDYLEKNYFEKYRYGVEPEEILHNGRTVKKYVEEAGDVYSLEYVLSNEKITINVFEFYFCLGYREYQGNIQQGVYEDVPGQFCASIRDNEKNIYSYVVIVDPIGTPSDEWFLQLAGISE